MKINENNVVDAIVAISDFFTKAESKLQHLVNIIEDCENPESCRFEKTYDKLEAYPHKIDELCNNVDKELKNHLHVALENLKITCDNSEI